MDMDNQQSQEYEDSKRREILTNASIYILQDKLNVSSAIQAAEQLFAAQEEAENDPNLSCVTGEGVIVFLDSSLKSPIFKGDERQRYAVYCKLCEAEQLLPKA
ncbi:MULTISPECIES: hypothetical protein [Serratia]|uniref:Uncharacterized protein n=1 Tax=Serratia fonticola TaxID=47917 RepID=A0AAE7EIW8_SERFO|nr:MULTISPECIES: hypothetical protein [Serratia]QKJ59489.1 hypothetical protein G9399_15590 [Serratia fonticola]